MKLNGRAQWDSNFLYREVWFSASNMKKDDFISKGFVKIPVTDKSDYGAADETKFLRELNSDGEHHWDLTVLSTNLNLDWDKETELSDFKL